MTAPRDPEEKGLPHKSIQEAPCLFYLRSSRCSQAWAGLSVTAAQWSFFPGEESFRSDAFSRKRIKKGWKGLKVRAWVPLAVPTPAVTPRLQILHRGVCWWHVMRNPLPGQEVLVILQILEVHIRLGPHCIPHPPACQHLLCCSSFCSPQYSTMTIDAGRHNVLPKQATAENTPALDFGVMLELQKDPALILSKWLNVKMGFKKKNLLLILCNGKQFPCSG